MTDETAGHDLASIITVWIWQADLGLRKRDRLTALEVEALCRARSDLPLDLRRLQKALKALAAAEASEIEQCVTRILRNADLICHLKPVPTPNARKAVAGENPRRAREGKAKRAEGVNQACEAEFTKRLKNLPVDWDGATGVMKEVRHATGAINATLERQKIKGLTERTVYKRFRKFVKEKR